MKGKTTLMSGTSYAAAFAAGAAARVVDRDPQLSPQQVIALLKTTSVRVSPNGPAVLNVDNALDKVGRAAAQSSRADAGTR
jgi:subtilisin family serine protease